MNCSSQPAPLLGLRAMCDWVSWRSAACVLGSVNAVLDHGLGLGVCFLGGKARREIDGPSLLVWVALLVEDGCQGARREGLSSRSCMLPMFGFSCVTRVRVNASVGKLPQRRSHLEITCVFS